MHNFRLNNLKFKHSNDDITIDFYFSLNFTNIKNIKKMQSNYRFVKIHIQ